MTKTLCCYIIGCFQPIRLNAFLKESLYLCMDSPQSKTSFYDTATQADFTFLFFNRFILFSFYTSL